jgi:phage terminase large subunit-like protein
METEPEIREIIDLMIKDRNFRVAMANEDPRLFFGAYLGHYATHPFSYFHFDMFDITKNPKYKTIVIMGARNCAKSTIMSTNLALWSILCKPQKKMVVIMGDTQVSAKKHFYDLRIELEGNKLLRSDLGPIQGEDGPWGPTLHLPKYGADIAFASIEQSVRGFKVGPNRPDLIIADDIENDASVRTLEGRNKVYDQITKVILPAGDSEKTRFVMLGTLLHEDSALMRFKREILAHTRDGTYREYPLLDEFGGALWPGKYPDKAALESLRRYVGNEKSYSQEYLLRIVPDEGRVIRPEWIHYEDCPAPTETNGFRMTFIGIDPAGSMSDDAAKTAMVVMRLFGRGNQIRLYVLPFPVNERFGMPQLLARAKMLADQYTVGSNRPRIIVEDFGMQDGIADLLKEDRYLAEAVRPPGDKFQRLALTGPRLEDKSVRFARHGDEALINQLVNFESETFKDLADAFSMLVIHVMSGKHQYAPIQWPKESPMDNKIEMGEEDDFADMRPITAGDYRELKALKRLGRHGF